MKNNQLAQIEPTWKIIFRGGIQLKFNPITVKSALIQMYLLTEEQQDRFFSGREITLKKGLTKSEGEQYLSVFEQRGLCVYLEVDEDKLFIMPDSALDQLPELKSAQKQQPKRGFFARLFKQADTRQTYGHMDSHVKLDDTGLGSYSPLNTLHVTEDGQETGIPDYLSLSFSGRYGCFNYINACLILVLVSLALAFLIILEFGQVSAFPKDFSSIMSSTSILGLFAFALSPFLITGSIFLYTRATILRLHDLNLSGLWFLPVAAIIGGGQYFDVFAEQIGIIITLIFCCIPGRHKINIYGLPSRRGSPVGLGAIFVLIVFSSIIQTILPQYSPTLNLEKIIKTK